MGATEYYAMTHLSGLMQKAIATAQYSSDFIGNAPTSAHEAMDLGFGIRPGRKLQFKLKAGHSVTWSHQLLHNISGRRKHWNAKNATKQTRWICLYTFAMVEGPHKFRAKPHSNPVYKWPLSALDEMNAEFSRAQLAREKGQIAFPIPLAQSADELVTCKYVKPFLNGFDELAVCQIEDIQREEFEYCRSVADILDDDWIWSGHNNALFPTPKGLTLPFCTREMYVERQFMKKQQDADDDDDDDVY